MEELDEKKLEKNQERKKGRNLKKDEVKKLIQEFVKIVSGIKINKKLFAIEANSRLVKTNPDLTIEEIQKVLKVDDKSKVDFLRQLYIRGGQSILNKLFPNETIVNLPTVSFIEEGNAIKLSY